MSDEDTSLQLVLVQELFHIFRQDGVIVFIGMEGLAMVSEVLIP